MSLRDIQVKNEYRSLIDNVVQDFYIPLLKEAVTYKRAVGFFSSSSLVKLTKGIASLAERGGKIQIVASPYLSEEDIDAIKKGYSVRNQIIENALLRQISDAPGDYFASERLNLLANLIADGTLDIRIAYTEDNHGIGMYHEKMGLIEDAEDNVVAFSGSMNESATAMAINYETIDVYRNWIDDNECARARTKQSAFHAIWNNCEPSIEVLEFPQITQALIEKYKRKPANYNIDREEFSEDSSAHGVNSVRKEFNGPRIPKSVKLHDYQQQAISAWAAQNYRGIFDMATGTGKTFTGLGAISKLSRELNGNLAVVIVCPYQHLVEQWVEDLEKFNISPIVGHSASKQRNWYDKLANAIRYFKLGIPGREFFCFISTNSTFSTAKVQRLIQKMSGNILFVADEAHNLGAQNLKKLLPENFIYRLGLSATLERHGDEEGTASLIRYFGEKCIEYSLDRAIAEKKLTPYKYYPIPVYLTEVEYEEYERLTKEISKNIVKAKGGKVKLTEYGKIVAMKRARLVAAASGKLEALREAILPYRDDNYILVYCGAASIFQEDEYGAKDEDDELRQIDLVTNMLGNDLGMKVSQFTSKEDMDERMILKQEFAKGDNLQALIAIKCLDEGVNIPQIRTAFILASTTNPKEYIQRRGRVLRLAEGKECAEIYDFITLARPLEDVQSLPVEYTQYDKSLVVRELARMEEFARIADNPIDSHELIWDIREAYHIEDIPEDSELEI